MKKYIIYYASPDGKHDAWLEEVFGKLVTGSNDEADEITILKRLLVVLSLPKREIEK